MRTSPEIEEGLASATIEEPRSSSAAMVGSEGLGSARTTDTPASASTTSATSATAVSRVRFRRAMVHLYHRAARKVQSGRATMPQLRHTAAHSAGPR